MSGCKDYSWVKYKDRKNEYCEIEDEFCDYDNITSNYGLLEDLTMCNCYGVEEVYNIYED